MHLDWMPFVELVQRHQRFLIMTHVRPDGDALGSELALAAHLRQHGKTARVVVASNVPPRYRFLDPKGSAIERFRPPGDEFRDIDVIIIVDTGTWNQLGDFADFMKSMTVPKVVIDHHRTQDDLGALRFVDTSAEAAGRLVYDACKTLGQPLSLETAQALFLAVATDTGWFHHPNTTASTFALADELTRVGAQPSRIYDELYDQSSLGRLKLIGRVLERIKLVADGQVAYAQVFLSDFPETGAIPPDTEDLINYPRSVEGVEVAMMMIEQQNKTVKVSFRSRSRIEVDRIAERFAGGGHKLASGATIPGTMEDVCAKVVKVVLEALMTQPPSTL
jgi:phosphoesterase RecJ-like protein